MATFNNTTRDIRAKIVYYGPGQSGKTTNIQYIHAKLKEDLRGDLMTLATEQDRTLFFDYLPVDLGEISGFKTRIQVYTVPGQVFYNSTRKLVLKNADGIVFVADSSRRFLKDNLESFQNLIDNLRDYGLKVTDLPLVVQFNKRDAPDAMPVAELQEKLNRAGFPQFEAVASSGQGVLPTFQGLTKLVLKHIKDTTIGGMPPLPGSQRPVPRPALRISPAPSAPVPSLEGEQQLDADEEALLDSLGPPSTGSVAPAASAPQKPDAVPTAAILAAAGIPAPAAKNVAPETVSKIDPVPTRLAVTGIGSIETAPGGGILVTVRLKDPLTGKTYEAKIDLSVRAPAGGK